MHSTDPHRIVLIDAARRVVEGKLPVGAFSALTERRDYADRRLATLIQRIEHLPSKSRLFGVGTKEYEREMAEIRKLIDEADQD